MAKEKRYANLRGYTDVHPYEVVARTRKTILVRAMDSKLDPDWKPEIVAGGFAGHCTNGHTQRWNITSNPQNPVYRAYLRKNGYYYSAMGKHGLDDYPDRFHDYNF